MTSFLHGKSITPELKETWLEERYKFIGSSEIATAVGINPYESPLRLWLAKTRSLPPKEASQAMEIGNLIEPAILNMYEHFIGHTINHKQMFYVSDETPFLCATLDGITDNHVNVQAKNVGCALAHLWGPEGTDEVPHYVIAQVQQEMYCSGLEKTHVAALIGGSEFRVYEIDRDPEIMKHLISLAEKFMERVRNNIYPEPSRDDDDELVKYLFPGCNGEAWFTEQQSADVLRWERLKGELKQLEKIQKDLKLSLSLAMGEASQARLVNGQTLYRRITTVPASVRMIKAYSFPVLSLKGEPRDEQNENSD